MKAATLAGLAVLLCGLLLRTCSGTDPRATLAAFVVASVAAAVAAMVTTRRHRLSIEHTALCLTAPENGVRLGPGPEDALATALLKRRTQLLDMVASHRALREQAEEVEHYETEFLRSLSHELRTPLNAIVGFTQVLLDEIDGPIDASQREDLEIIRASGTHLAELVDDVLDLAAMQSAQFHLERTDLDLKPIVKEVAQLLEGQRRGKPVEIQLLLPEGPLPVYADPRRMRQVVMNLATNALKFTEAGSVQLVGTVEDDGVEVLVSDTGPGIGADDLARIFEEFAQAGDIRRKGQGTGLGLAICRRLVHLHGGAITVESVVGQGSTFRVRLPKRGAAR